MSFLKRDVKTVNPAGGVNPAQEPNVGQYGWTSYDAANVNQLIEYVNMAAESAKSAKDSADYVNEKYEELQDFIEYINVIYKEIGPIFDNIDTIYQDILLKHKEVTTMNKDVHTALVETLAASNEAKQSENHAEAHAHAADVSADESEASAVKSAASAVDSAASAKTAADIAEELRKGQVYRGTWNIEEAAAFPPTPDTNSVWDITLKESSVSYVFNGETWFWGDRLLYLKDDDKFSQIESGSGVISVNGKSGAVTLNATDVGAVSLTGNSTVAGYLTATQLITTSTDDYGIRLVEAGKTLYFQGGKTDRDVTDQKIVMSGWYGTPLSFYRIAMAEGKHAYIQQGGTDYRIYHQGFKPTADEINAVGKVGDQVMAGALSAVKYTASDTYGFISATRPYQGMYMGKTEGDRRTIIGGGGDAAGDATGSVLVRPNGITDPAGVTLFNGDGTIANANAPTHVSHLTNKNYVDGQVKVVNDKVGPISTLANNAMPKSGGIFEGAIRLKNGLPSALKVNDQSSISYQQGGGSVIHNFASGNNLHWAHGINAENTMAILSIDGSFQTKGPQYAKTAHVARNSTENNWLAMECPEEGAPYISSKTPAEPQPFLAMRFGQTEISVESGKRLASQTFRVGDNAGLRFSAKADLSGTTWGMGLDSANERLGIHRYVNGAWAQAPMEVSKEGAVFFNTNVSTSGSFNSTGGYIVATRADNPMLELHSPGNYAGAIYIPGTGRMRFAESNGAGGETRMYAEFQAGAAHFSTCVRPAIKDASWGGWGDTVGGIQDNTGSRIINPGTWHPMVTSASYVDPVQGYAGRWSIGYYRPAAQHNGEFVINMNGDGFLRNNLRLVMSGAGGGGIRMDGTEAGQTWAIQEGGFLYGSSFGAYANMVNWCTGSFAPISDGKLKRNIKPATKSALDDIAQIEFKSYEWREDAKVANMEPTKIGLVAQEMEAIDPSYTRDIQTFNPDGSVDTSVKGLDVTNMLALALKAIQEQQVQINELKEKLNEFIQQ